MSKPSAHISINYQSEARGEKNCRGWDREKKHNRQGQRKRNKNMHDNNIELTGGKKKKKKKQPGATEKKKQNKNRAHVSARAAAAFPSVKVGILCEHLVPTGRVDIHLLLCLNIMEISLFN